MNSKDNINKYIFWIPMLYNFSIRLKNNPSRIISWLFINLFPTIYYSLTSIEKITISNIIILIIFTFGVLFMYEWGYIYNDTKTIKREENPSKRLSEKELDYSEKHFTYIFSFRICLFIISMIITYISNAQTLTAIIIAIICPILFYQYNNWRSKYNVFLYFFLVTSRFLPFALLFNNNSYIISILIILIYPLEIGIERFSITKYRFKHISKIIPDEGSKTKFRAIYYIIISTILTILYFDKIIPSITILIPYYIFTLYRCLLLTKNHI